MDLPLTPPKESDGAGPAEKSAANKAASKATLFVCAICNAESK